MGRSSCSRLLITPFLLTAVLAIDKYIQDADRFPGWKGELPKSSQPGVESNVDEHSKVLPILQMQSQAGAVTHSSICCPQHTDQLHHLQDHWTGEVIELSWQPRAFLFKKFMTEAECDHLIEKASCYIMLCHQLSVVRHLSTASQLKWHMNICFSALQAKPSMTKSSVVDSQTGKSMDSTVRTSTGTFFARGQDEVLEAIERRIAQVTYSQLAYDPVTRMHMFHDSKSCSSSTR